MNTGVGNLHSIEWGDPVEAIEKCYELGWTDGLPVVPPTLERVRDFLDYAGRPADEVVGSLPERRREVTVGKVAANAVMAGCLPEYAPVVLAATEAMPRPKVQPDRAVLEPWRSGDSGHRQRPGCPGVGHKRPQ